MDRKWWFVAVLAVTAMALLCAAVLIQSRQLRDVNRRDVCRDRYTRHIAEEQFEYLSSIGRLVVAIADDGDLDAQIDDLRASNQMWADAIAARDSYDADGAPLPCPLDQGESP